MMVLRDTLVYDWELVRWPAISSGATHGGWIFIIRLTAHGFRELRRINYI